MSFAKDSNGNWGYKIGGAGSVIPFKNKYSELDFSSITDEQFAEVVSALDEGKITINDLSWKVGDTRTIHLSAMSSYANDSHTVYAGEIQPEQDVTFVIQNIGGVTLTNGKECHYVFGMKNCLSKVGYLGNQSSYTSWEVLSRHEWCNNTFRNAIPETIRGCFKQFKCISASSRCSSTSITTNDYFALPALNEIWGSNSRSTDAEAHALIQFEWYKIKNNKYKLTDDNGGIIMRYWTRSISNESGSSYDYYSCVTEKSTYDVPTSITIGKDYCSTKEGISPFGCI